MDEILSPHQKKKKKPQEIYVCIVIPYPRQKNNNTRLFLEMGWRYTLHYTNALNTPKNAH